MGKIDRSLMTWADRVWACHELGDKAPAECQQMAALRRRRVRVASMFDPFRKPVAARPEVGDRIVAACAAFRAVDVVVPVSRAWLARAILDCRGERSPDEASEARLRLAREEWGYSGDSVPASPSNLWIAATTASPRRMGDEVDTIIATRTAGKRCLLIPNMSEPFALSDCCNVAALDWVVLTAHGSFSYDAETVEAVLDECDAAQVPLWIDNLGPSPTIGTRPIPMRCPRGSNWDDWPTHLRVRSIPT